jgi:hypothetical protein
VEGEVLHTTWLLGFLRQIGGDLKNAWKALRPLTQGPAQAPQGPQPRARTFHGTHATFRGLGAVRIPGQAAPGQEGRTRDTGIDPLAPQAREAPSTEDVTLSV